MDQVTFSQQKLQGYPFDLVDRLLHWDQDQCLTSKTITRNEWLVARDQTGQLVYPWWGLAESMAQSAGRYDEYLRHDHCRVFLTRMNHFTWQRLPQPGETLYFKTALLKRLQSLSVFHVQATLDQQPIASGEFYFASLAITPMDSR